ncbi:hypothetical protein [Brevibacillus brevis]|uniref:hypothetical protein n=1 Tax=Brevibacillus brevis TaxID=1393 RepID=UPI0011572EAA|nr:hypothetical protein [Lysinibacillus sp. SDF0063]TQR39153.1 hypothetical protein C7Y45_03590 [Lysinibacillus sp. SDF0063]
MVSVVIDESTLEVSSRKTITGEVYFQFGDSVFPDSNWNDFVVVILTWWNKSIKILETSSVGTSQDFNFMDGPFYVRGVKENSAEISLHFTRRNKEGLEVIASVGTEIDSLKKSIVNASRKVMKEINTNNWLTDEVEELKRLI